MASLFAQFMSSADDVVMDDSSDLDWSPEISSNSEASTEDFGMDVEDAELNAEEEAAEEEDEYYVNLHVLACCKKEGSWALEALNWDDDISQVSFRLSKRVEVSAYQIYRLIQRSLPLSSEFQHGFRIYVGERAYFQHDGKGDAAGNGTDSMRWFTLELFNALNADLGPAKRFYGKGMAFGFLQRETLAGETLNFSVVVTPYNEALPTCLTLRYEDSVIEDVSPFCSLYDFHRQQKQKKEELWEPPYPLSRCYNFRTPVAALGWKVQ